MAEVRKEQPFCTFNQEINCRNITDINCPSCGWNPEVAEKRIKALWQTEKKKRANTT